MRYIGSKQPVLSFLEKSIISEVGDVEKLIFADLFAGTCSVSILFKKLGSKIIANDYMAYSFVLETAFLGVDAEPGFNGLKHEGLNNYQEIIQFLNKVSPIKGFFYYNYSPEGSKNTKYQRNYFSGINAQKIDSIMKHLANWKINKNINQQEEFVLRASLLEAITKVSNVSGTYGAFLKVDDKRKYKSIVLDPIEFIYSNEEHKCYNEDILKIIDHLSGDVLYLDPPYNQRQYPPYYHILETAALDDNPQIYGKTGRRPYKDKLSPFCNKREAYSSLDSVIRRARFKHVFLSYNNDGIISEKELEKLLSKYGDIKIFRQDHRRYKSNSNGGSKESLKELLFYVKKEV